MDISKQEVSGEDLYDPMDVLNDSTDELILEDSIGMTEEEGRFNRTSVENKAPVQERLKMPLSVQDRLGKAKRGGDRWRGYEGNRRDRRQPRNRRSNGYSGDKVVLSGIPDGFPSSKLERLVRDALGRTSSFIRKFIGVRKGFATIESDNNDEIDIMVRKLDGMVVDGKNISSQRMTLDEYRDVVGSSNADGKAKNESVRRSGSERKLESRRSRRSSIDLKTKIVEEKRLSSFLVDRNCTYHRIKITNINKNIDSGKIVNEIESKFKGKVEVLVGPVCSGAASNRFGWALLQDWNNCEKFKDAVENVAFFGYRVRLDRPVTVRRDPEFIVHISNISYEVSSVELEEILSAEAECEVSVDLPQDHDGMHTGSGKLILKSEEAAHKILSQINGLDLGGQSIELVMGEGNKGAVDDQLDEFMKMCMKAKSENEANQSEGNISETDDVPPEEDDIMILDMDVDEDNADNNISKDNAPKDCDKRSSRDHDDRSRNHDKRSSNDNRRVSKRLDDPKDSDKKEPRPSSSRSKSDVSSSLQKRLDGTPPKNKERDDKRKMSSRPRDEITKSRDRSRTRDRRDRPRSRDRAKSREESRGSRHQSSAKRRIDGVLVLRDFDEMKSLTRGRMFRLWLSKVSSNASIENVIQWVNKESPGLETIIAFKRRSGELNGEMILEFNSERASNQAFMLLPQTNSWISRNIVAKLDDDYDRHHVTGEVLQPRGVEHNMGGFPGPRPPPFENMNMIQPDMPMGHPEMGMPGPDMMGPSPHQIINPVVQMGIGRDVHGLNPMGMPMQNMNMGLPGQPMPINPNDGLLGAGPGAPMIQANMNAPFAQPMQPQMNNMGMTTMPMGHNPNMGMTQTPVMMPQFERPQLNIPIERMNQDNGPRRGGRTESRDKASWEDKNSRKPLARNPSPPPPRVNVPKSNETSNFGLSEQFLQSLDISLPIVKELLVSNIDRNASNEDLKDLFAIAGTVSNIDYHPDKGQAIVAMHNEVEAVQAISMLHNQEYFDTVISVRMSRPNDPNNLIRKQAIKAPRGLKSVGKGLGIDGRPLASLAADSKVPIISQSLDNSSNKRKSPTGSFSNDRPRKRESRFDQSNASIGNRPQGDIRKNNTSSERPKEFMRENFGRQNNSTDNQVNNRRDRDVGTNQNIGLNSQNAPGKFDGSNEKSRDGGRGGVHRPELPDKFGPWKTKIEPKNFTRGRDSDNNRSRNSFGQNESNNFNKNQGFSLMNQTENKNDSFQAWAANQNRNLNEGRNTNQNRDQNNFNQGHNPNMGSNQVGRGNNPNMGFNQGMGSGEGMGPNQGRGPFQNMGSNQGRGFNQERGFDQGKGPNNNRGNNQDRGCLNQNRGSLNRDRSPINNRGSNQDRGMNNNNRGQNQDRGSNQQNRGGNQGRGSNSDNQNKRENRWGKPQDEVPIRGGGWSRNEKTEDATHPVDGWRNLMSSHNLEATQNVSNFRNPGSFVVASKAGPKNTPFQAQESSMKNIQNNNRDMMNNQMMNNQFRQQQMMNEMSQMRSMNEPPKSVSSTVGREVIITNLPSSARLNVVQEMCSVYGNVKDVQINPRHRTGRVIYETYQQANMAVDMLNDHNYNGTCIKTMLA